MAYAVTGLQASAGIASLRSQPQPAQASLHVATSSAAPVRLPPSSRPVQQRRTLRIQTQAFSSVDAVAPRSPTQVRSHTMLLVPEQPLQICVVAKCTLSQIFRTLLFELL